MKTGLFIGRFQPFHDGHKACIRKILEDCDAVVVGVRSGPIDDDNPYTFSEVFEMIRKEFPHGSDRSTVRIIQLPDVGRDLVVYHGRDVGYSIEKLEMGEEIEAISASAIRAGEGCGS
jgi:cytidyltransferase-like protein